MYIDMSVDGRHICQFEVWADKAPELIEVLTERLPMRSTLQHSKLLGDMLFFSLPITIPWQNLMLTADVAEQRRRTKGAATGSVCFYNPRQQICIPYGDDLAPERLKISYVGEVVSGLSELRLIGLETWFKQGALVELTASAAQA
jgi:hypothetical protein